ncbi:MAG: radical SAM domain-containing protein [Desulfopila sp.]
MNGPYYMNGNSITLDKKGADSYIKVSYPQRFGIYSELETPDAVYQFNLSGEIRFLKSKHPQWPDPQEWLKRTIGNDWIYYSTGGYAGVYEAIGEYYLPNLQYPTNSLIGGKPFGNSAVRQSINNWHEDIVRLRRDLGTLPRQLESFFDTILAADPAVLAEKARRLFAISGGRVTVLPPDARHVDYDIIPLTIASGCLYKCRFCKVKNTHRFKEKDPASIEYQLDALRQLYGDDLKNYNSIFVGEHDALCSSSRLLLMGVERGYEKLGFDASHMRGANFFLFGSVDSLLGADTCLFDRLAGIKGNFYINIGFESADQETLDMLGKPVTAAHVVTAFQRMQEINDTYGNIEVSGNFLMDQTLPGGHYPRLVELVRESLPRKKPKGCIYLSPLKFDRPSRELVFDFHRLKLQSRLPTLLYIIQRL